jgi:putative ABC transport system permease protein
MTMRLYRWLLRLVPGSLRGEYGAAMEETAERRLTDARRQGTWAVARFWRRELASALSLAASERWGTTSRARRRRHISNIEKAGFMDRLTLELRQAFRRLWRSPAFTVTAVLTLALAIGANASIFAVVERVVLNSLPYPDSDRLIVLDHGSKQLNIPEEMGLTPGLYLHYAERSRTLQGLAVFRSEDVTLTGDGEPERISVTRATVSLATVLRVSPEKGRWFTQHEGEPGAARTVVLSHRLWERRYGGDASIIGRQVILSGVPAEVVGIMPASFAFPQPRVEAWVSQPISRTGGFGLWNYQGIARLADGATLETARAELDGLIADLVQAFPGDPRALGNWQSQMFFSGRILKDVVIGGVTRMLWVLLASAMLVLLVACANVANLFLVRTEARQREVAVRRALGAGRMGIARYFLTESVLLAIAGGAIGQAIAWGAVRVLVASGPATLPRLSEVRIDGLAVAFTCGLTAFAALAFGLIPLWREAPSGASLHESGRANTASRVRFRARHVLMGVQIAVALVLLVSSGLMIRSFQELRALDPGFDGGSALTFSIGLPNTEYRTMDEAVRAHGAILDGLSALPGVMHASATTCLPLSRGCHGNTLRVEGKIYPEGTIPPMANFRAVAGGYFQAMGMTLHRGRLLDRGDVDRKEPVVVINEALAKRVFAGEDPIGKRIASNRARDEKSLTWLEIVGVVSNTPVHRLVEPNGIPQMYMPMSIAGGPGIPMSMLVGPDISMMNYVVRSTTPPLGLMPAVRRVIEGFDDQLAIAQVRTLQDLLDRASAQMAFTMVLLAIAAGVALTLGLIGTYGVMSYIVTQRTGEIGVRLALGAEPGGVARQVVRQGGTVALAGVIAGLAIALAGGRLIESLLYGVSPRDPAVFAATTMLLLIVALLACWLPARRAARLNPIEALRAE